MTGMENVLVKQSHCSLENLPLTARGAGWDRENDIYPIFSYEGREGEMARRL